MTIETTLGGGPGESHCSMATLAEISLLSLIQCCMDALEDRSVIIDPRLESYEGFLEDDFTRAAFEASDRSGRRISHLIFNLLIDWRSISYAVAFPSLAPTAIENFHAGMASQGPVDYSLLGFLEYVLSRLRERVPSLTNDHALQSELIRELLRVSSDVRGLQTTRDSSVSASTIWQQYIQHHPFHLGLHGIMRLAYIGIYGAYEEFVVRCARISTGNPNLQSTNSNFSAILGDSVGSDLRESCWDSEEIKQVRRIRNKLTHAGGQVDKSTRDLTSLVHIQDDFMHIFPEHLKQSYDRLKTPALAIMLHDAFI